MSLSPPPADTEIRDARALDRLVYEILERRQPVVILVGPPGIGKSTTTWHLTIGYRAKFNTITRYTEEKPPFVFARTSQDALTHKGMPNLAIFDDIDFVHSSTWSNLPHYLRVIEHPQTLFVGRSPAPITHLFGDAPVIQMRHDLGYRFNDLRNQTEGLLRELIARPDELNADDYKAALELISALRQPFTRPGLLGPDGEPLGKGSTAARQLITDANTVNRALLAEINRNPDLVYELTPRRWEELVAQIYADEGYDVSLTQPSKDGGYDIQLVRKDRVGSALILVECKRYSPSNPVELGIVKQLHSTMLDNKATQGVVVTTSRFTKGAKLYEQRHQWQLSLTDYAMFRSWLRDGGY